MAWNRSRLVAGYVQVVCESHIPLPSPYWKSVVASGDDGAPAPIASQQPHPRCHSNVEVILCFSEACSVNRLPASRCQKSLYAGWLRSAS